MGLPAGVALKLDRADEHVQALQVAHEKFLATNPYVSRRIIEGKDAEKAREPITSSCGSGTSSRHLVSR